MKRTLYQILGVDPKASRQDIAAAYARLAAADWPDSGMPGLLRQANEILSDPGRRQAYDASLVEPVVEPEWDSEPTFLGTWGKWIAAIVIVIGTVMWWSSRREAPSAPEAAPQPAAARPIEGAPPPSPAAVSADQATESSETKEPAPPAAAPPAPPATPASRVRSAEDVFADVAPSVARVNVMDVSGRMLGTGSGVVIDNGTLLTSCHVALLGAQLAVKIGDAVLPATVQLPDEAFDLCRLNVPGMRAPALTIGSVNSLRTGQRVYAIGAPAGLELTISEGIVSALRKVDEGTVIQTTAPISPGSSGGGLFDLSGQLVGIMTFQHRYGQNLNFALPADWIGQMRARRAGQPGWRTAVADRSQAPPPAALIVGRWLCRDWTSGRAMEYSFEIDGRLGISTADNQAATLRYGVSGKSLQISDAKQAITLVIGELTAARMILQGRDRNIACERP
ncbi:MAG TPA: trypsin-like peptidase domain-containing protein [Casimicrobiaceae bacterium]